MNEIIGVDAADTLDRFLDHTGLGVAREYVPVEPLEGLSGRDKHLLQWGRDKIRADGAILQRLPVTNSCFPLAYLRQLDSSDPAKIAEAHKLAWNMGRAPLLVLVLPARILVYSAYERPRPSRYHVALDEKAGLIDDIDLIASAERTRQALARYKREELLSGRFWERNRKRFDPRTRVEKTLLNNLSDVRSALIEDKALSAETVHRLLGRAIFIQFLQDRKDSKGYTAFPSGFFSQFLPGAESFPDVLADRDAAYKLFEYLQDKFNGDIFPVTSHERDSVEQHHLKFLADFLQGNIALRNRQMSFWPHYSFDAIPIEFISSMYEEFFHYERREQQGSQRRRRHPDRTGTYYTPHRLVEFVLDELFPWEGEQTHIRILDPACGSGIFLVEAYRRLISRWEQANPQGKLDVAVLRKLLTNCLFGVDQNREAIRVAAFSLYLTMCDYLDPRYVWAHVKFPPLHKRTLWDQDFFEFAGTRRTQTEKFDLVVGNPPWESQLPQEANRFLTERNLPVGDKQVAQAFLWAAPEVCRADGNVCLIAPSKGLLFNRSRPNRDFRRRFFNSYKVNTVVNFSALRRTLFANAVGPAAPVVYQPKAPGDSHEIVYCCPKPSNSPEDGWHYVIESRDTARIPLRMGASHDFIWKTAMWGGPRDWDLVSRLGELPSLADLAEMRGWVHGEGFIVGTSGRRKAGWLTGKPYVAPGKLKPFSVDEKSLPSLKESLFHRARKIKRKIFRGPHLLVGQSPEGGERLVATLLRDDAVFNQSILGIVGTKEDIGELGAVCVAFATNMCGYFAMMTSSRWLVERDELGKGEIMRFPIPRALYEGALPVPYRDLKAATRDTHSRDRLIQSIARAYGLDNTEQALVSDAVTYTLDYFRLRNASDRLSPTDTEMLRRYARTLCQSLKRSFGGETKAGFPATLYTGDMPMIVLAVGLRATTGTHKVEVRRASGELSDALHKMDRLLLEKGDSGVFVRRDVHVYDNDILYLAKRNQPRLWTESSAVRDADEIYAEVMTTWGQAVWD